MSRGHDRYRTDTAMHALKDSFRHRLAEACVADMPVYTNRYTLLKASFDACEVDGWVAEFGVYKGTTLRVIADHFADEVVHGFDSFEGLQEHWFGPKSRDNKLHTVGSYAAKNYKELPFPDNSEIHVGLVQDTVPEFAATQTKPAKFLHVDTDTYSPARAVLQICNERIVPGTVIQFDEFHGYHTWADHEARALIEWMMHNKRDVIPIGKAPVWQMAVKVVT